MGFHPVMKVMLEPSETICRYHRSMGHRDIPKQPKEEEVKRRQCLDVKILGIIEESFLAGIIPLKVAGKYRGGAGMGFWEMLGEKIHKTISTLFLIAGILLFGVGGVWSFFILAEGFGEFLKAPIGIKESWRQGDWTPLVLLLVGYVFFSIGDRASRDGP